MTVTPELIEILEIALENRLLDVHTSLPGAIQTYDPVSQTATIELQIQRPLEGDVEGEFELEDLPVLQNVRVVFPRTKKFMLTFPIEPGDTGDVFFAETPIGQWRAVDGVAVPESVGRFDLSGAKFYPGLSKDSENISDVIATEMVIGEIGGIQARVNSTAFEVVTGGAGPAADFVAMSAKVDLLWTTLYNLFVTGWTPAANDGGAALKTAFVAAFPPPGPSSVASSNLKAD